MKAPITRKPMVQVILLLYVFIGLIVTPYFCRGFVYERYSYFVNLLPILGIAFFTVAAIYFYLNKIEVRIEGFEKRTNELNKAGIENIRIDSKSSLKIIFDEINSKNYLVDFKIITDLNTIHENNYFLKDFIRNRRFDTTITMIISKPDSEESEMQLEYSLNELYSAKTKSNKKIRIGIINERTTFTSVIYDNYVWISLNGKKEIEDSIFIKVEEYSKIGRQIIDFFETACEKAKIIDIK